MTENNTLKNIGEVLTTVLLAPLMVAGCTTSYEDNYVIADEKPAESEEITDKKRQYNDLLRLQIMDKRCRGYVQGTIKRPVALSNPAEISIFEQCCIKDGFFAGGRMGLTPCDCSLFSPKVKEKCEQVQAANPVGCGCSVVSSGTGPSLLSMVVDSIFDSVVESVKAFF